MNPRIGKRVLIALIGSAAALFGQAGNAGYGVNGGGSGGGTYTFNAPLSLSGSTVSMGVSGVTAGDYTCLNAHINTYGIITTATSGSCGGGGGTWGSITGTLSAQTDLQTALNAKQNTITLLPVANGGTGTATPGLVAGTNVTISGTWPNQTINSSGGTGGSGVPAGTSLPASCTPGTDTLYLKTNNAPNQQLYSCSALNTWTQNELLGATGALAVNGTTGALDIVTTVVPRIAAANSFTGRNGFTAPLDLAMAPDATAAPSGYLSLYANSDGTLHYVNESGTDTPIGSGGSSFNQTIQVNGTPVTQRAKLNIAAGTNVTVTPTDNGSDTTTVTIAASGSGGTTVAANGPYLDIAGTHYIPTHMVVPTLFNNTGFTTAFGTAPTVDTTTTAPATTLSMNGGAATAYVKTLAGGTLDAVLNCSLASGTGGTDSACGLVTLDGSNNGAACYFKALNDSATAVRCKRITAGAMGADDFTAPFALYTVSDLFIGIHGADSNGAGAPNFVVSGDGGRTWRKLITYNFGLPGGNPTQAGIFMSGDVDVTVLSYNNH